MSARGSGGPAVGRGSGGRKTPATRGLALLLAMLGIWWIGIGDRGSVGPRISGAGAAAQPKPVRVRPKDEVARIPEAFLAARPTATSAPAVTTTEPPPTTTTTTRPLAAPYGDKVRGLLTFRGNPTRTYYGAGPVPREAAELWRFPERPMCSMSTVGKETSEWCGTGWTGQPAVFEREGRTWVVFGAYDRAVHFLDAESGERMRPDLLTGDLVKGSVTVDPDGYPLVYIGSRDDYLRVVAIDRAKPAELWRLWAYDVEPVLWNDDWDGSALVLDGHLVEGGENGQLHVVKLNRSYGADGLVTVKPEISFHAPAWDDDLLQSVGDGDVSVEGSVAVFDGIAYLANSGGLVQGWDLGGFSTAPRRVFRFWTGDDTDASVVIDEEGSLYVGSQWERHTKRAAEVGQMMKLNPKRHDPLVWSHPDQETKLAGVWATPALHRDIVIFATDGGRLIALDRATGAERWTIHLPGPTWQSPVVVDDVLLMGDCAGVFHAFDVSDTAVSPPELWSLQLPGCIESTPAVWNGRIYVGTRGGFVHAIG